MESRVVAPVQGRKITLQNSELNVPGSPIIPHIEDDGIGVDVTPAMLKVVDAEVEKAYKGEREIPWMEICTGEESTQAHGQDVWLSAETLDLICEYRVAIKGPLATLVGGGICPLDVVLRQELDLYIYLRPIRYYQSTPSPVKHPGLTDMIIFRESSEDIYAGIEWKADPVDAERMTKFLREKVGMKKVRFPEHCGTGVRSCSEEGIKHLVCATIECAIVNDRNFVTLVREGSIMKFTEGAFKDRGYQLTRGEFSGELTDGDPWSKAKNPNTGKEIVIKDVTVDAFLQRILLHPAECDVIACTNLNGDYVSDALTTQVGGVGITPGVNVGDEYALFEATHGTALKYAGQDKVNPDSIILSAEVILRYVGWTEAADLIIKGMEDAINTKAVTYDFERLMEGARLLKCLESGSATIKNM